MTARLTGHDALRYAERTGEPLNCYANPVDDGGVVTLEAAREIVREDPGLIYVDATQRLLSPPTQPSESQKMGLFMLSKCRPFMLTFGGLSPVGEWVMWFASTRARANRLMRQGWQVWEASR